MKDIKTFVIGFLTCCCLFLIMGQTVAKHDARKGELNKLLEESEIKERPEVRDKESKKHEFPLMEDIKTLLTENGRYQISSTVHLNKGVFETIIDTRTGEIFKRERVKFNQYDKIN